MMKQSVKLGSGFRIATLMLDSWTPKDRLAIGFISESRVGEQGSG